MRFTRVSEARYYYASRLGKARVVLLRDGALVAPLHAAAPLVERAPLFSAVMPT